MEPEKKTKITIIGAGLIGTTLSYYLSFNKNLNITVYEKERENSFLTSYANAGRFVPIGKFHRKKI
jgi:L-2-hydroxyglutarate oxidase LhgO